MNSLRWLGHLNTVELNLDTEGSIFSIMSIVMVLTLYSSAIRTSTRSAFLAVRSVVEISRDEP